MKRERQNTVHTMARARKSCIAKAALLDNQHRIEHVPKYPRFTANGWWFNLLRRDVKTSAYSVAGCCLWWKTFRVDFAVLRIAHVRPRLAMSRFSIDFRGCVTAIYKVFKKFKIEIYAAKS